MRLLAILLFPLLFAGCGSSSNQSRTEDGRIKVIFWHAMGGELERTLNSLVDEFNQTQREIRVESISMGMYDTLNKKLLASIIARSNPDISQNSEALTQMFKAAGKIVAIDDFFTDPQALLDYKSDFVPSLLANNTFDGKLWSIPFNKSLAVLYINKEHFQAVQLDPENPPKTWTEVASAALLLQNWHQTRNLGGYPFGATRRCSWFLQSLICQLGGRVLDEEKREPGLDTPATFEALEFVRKLNNRGILKLTKGLDFQSDFITGKCSMMVTSVVSKTFIDKKIPFPFGMSPLPYYKIPASVLSGANVNIFKQPDDPDRTRAAWTFLKWFTDTDQTARWSIQTTYVPVRKSAIASELMQKEFRRDKNTRAAVDQLDYSTWEPRLGAWFEIRQILDETIEKALMMDKDDPAQVRRYLAEAHAIAANILKDE